MIPRLLSSYHGCSYWEVGREKNGLGRVHTQLDMSFSEMDTDTTRALICFVERSCLGYGFVVCDGAGGIPDFDLR